MSKNLWITNARVIDPASKRDEKGDLFAVDGKLVDKLTAEQKKSARKIDAGGLVAAPGFVDIHVHFREPGQTHKETIETGTRAAGGHQLNICRGQVQATGNPTRKKRPRLTRCDFAPKR